MTIRSHVDYCDVIYHIPPTYAFPFTLNSLMEKLERVQYNAALTVTSTLRGTNRSKLYEELGWESLNDRRLSRRLIQLYKIHNNLTPGCLRDNHLPPVRFSLYGVRHSHIAIFIVIQAVIRTVFFQVQLNYGITWVTNFKIVNILKPLRGISYR